MSTITLVTFAIVAFIPIAVPGPTVLLAMTNGSRHGVRRACFGMAGAIMSDFILVGAAAMGLGALLAASQFWFEVVKWIGVLYLAFLGIMLLYSKGKLHAPEQLAGDADTARALFSRSLLVAVTNPKGYLFVSAFLPQFITPDAPMVPQYVALAIVFAAVDFFVMFGYALLGSRAIRLLKRSGALWLDRICGAVLLSLAASLALYRRAGR
ncbi:MAG: LysE family translocator [Pseudomonadota bacterium]